MQFYLPVLFLKCFKRLLVLAYLSFTCASAFLQVNNVLKATGFPFGFQNYICIIANEFCHKGIHNENIRGN